ncbi:MAG: hypothetical protein GDA44_13085 [Prochloron sp. SP5CPC1]|nr:hypothetical protein [Candidatus Paraprochloron terpiosi SP5CPC1]
MNIKDSTIEQLAGNNINQRDNIGTQNNYYRQPENPEILAEELDALLEKEIQGEIIPGKKNNKKRSPL